MRRKDREVAGLENILEIMEKCEVMRLGLCADNRPYIVPMNFAWEEKEGEIRLFFHCASEGQKIDMMALNHHVCFEADCAYQIIQNEEACKWSARFQSVMGEGRVVILKEEEEKIHGLDLIMKRYGFQGTPQYPPQVIAAVTVLMVKVTSMTGKARQ